jgi:hypothetical protein
MWSPEAARRVAARPPMWSVWKCDRERRHRPDRLERGVRAPGEGVGRQRLVKVPQDPVGALGHAREDVFRHDAAREQVPDPPPGSERRRGGRLGVLGAGRGDRLPLPSVPHHEGHDVSLESACADSRTPRRSREGPVAQRKAESRRPSCLRRNAAGGRRRPDGFEIRQPTDVLQ